MPSSTPGKSKFSAVGFVPSIRADNVNAKFL